MVLLPHGKSVVQIRVADVLATCKSVVRAIIFYPAAISKCMLSQAVRNIQLQEAV
jgi:hypothetical protein